MTDVKEAVKKAAFYFSDLMEDKISDVWLEEVEPSPDERLWYVTLSGLAPTRKTGAPETAVSKLAEAFGGPPVERLYRIFTVDANSGTVKSMKIRKPA
jgi:hypothetical protein